MFFAMGMTEGKPRGGGSARSGGWRKLLAGCLLGGWAAITLQEVATCAES